ncbi:MAG TPA: hypothetical protein PLA43_21185 [Bryobacteraceae bacterium]|nr:hypothetical protein [Bryobacteraceae bacterium]HPU74477.1 hypothetical protein [Bryobacteraceae bacterium]
MAKPIPLYAADLHLCDWISEQRANRLERLGLAKVVRHPKGHIARCIFHRRPGEPVVRFRGRAYSYREHLANGKITWSLRRLGKCDELRPLFLQVVADCLVER